MKIRYESFDGKPFDTEAECAAHEATMPERRLVGLTEEQIAAALDRTDADLANAIELLGRRIAKTRVAAGERKRKPKGETAAQTSEVV